MFYWHKQNCKKFDKEDERLKYVFAFILRSSTIMLQDAK